MNPIMPCVVAERTPLLSGGVPDDDLERSSYTNQPYGSRQPQPQQQHQPRRYSYPHPQPQPASASSSYPSVSYSAPNSPFSPRPRPRAVQTTAPNDAVRRNLFTFLTAHLQLCLALTFILPQVMAITFVLATHWDTETCDQPLHLWTAVYGARLLLSLSLAVLPFLPAPVSRPLSRVLLSSPSAFELLHVFSFVWFVLGSYWLFHSTDCQSSAPAVFQLVSVMLLLNCVLLFLPLLLFLLLCPFLYFCAPIIIRLVVLRQDMTRERSGLPADVIQSLPSLTSPQPVTTVRREAGQQQQEGGGGEVSESESESELHTTEQQHSSIDVCNRACFNRHQQLQQSSTPLSPNDKMVMQQCGHIYYYQYGNVI